MDTAIIFVALIGLMVMAYRGASIILIAPVFAVVAALGSEHASLPIFSELYMTKAAEYLKNYYPIFLFGAVFARLMEKGGMAASVAGKIIEILGERRIYVQIFSIARWDGFAETSETSCPALTFGNEMVRTTLSLYLEKIGIQDYEGSFFSLCLLIIGVTGTGVATAAGCQRACNVVRNVLVHICVMF